MMPRRRRIAALTADFTGLPVIVRVNAADTPWHEGYLAAVQRLPIAAMVQHVPT
jgi:citrate lyase subunit beta/citryl-CoA lyase